VNACERVVVLDNGILRADGTVEDVWGLVEGGH